jgi:CRISPR/Cas system-associated exonuclease Cas4 (RecB family)
MNKFSPNMLKTYQNCPKKFYYKYVEKFNVPTLLTPFEKGKKIHALAHYFLQGINISRIETSLNEEEHKLWQLLLTNPYFRKDCLNSEYQLACKIEDFWVGGRLDAVVYDGGEYFILDYKTGSIPKNPTYDFQTMVYCLALDSFLDKYEKLSFIYLNLKDKTNFVIEFNENLKKEYIQEVGQMCKNINSDKIYPCNFTRCSRCEYARICEKFI